MNCSGQRCPPLRNCKMRKVVSKKVPALPKGNLQSTNPVAAQVSRGLVPERESRGQDFQLLLVNLRQKLATSVGQIGRQMQRRNRKKFSTNGVMITFYQTCRRNDHLF